MDSGKSCKIMKTFAKDNVKNSMFIEDNSLNGMEIKEDKLVKNEETQKLNIILSFD